MTNKVKKSNNSAVIKRNPGGNRKGINPKKKCSICGSKKTSILKSNNRPDWRHSIKKDGKCVCKICYCKQYRDSKTKHPLKKAVTH